MRGISLRGDDRVVGVALVEEGKYLLTLTEQGLGKRTDFEDFRLMKNRGGHGVTCHRLTEKSGRLAAIATVCEDDDIMIITNEGVIIRTRVSDIPVYSRTAGGVIVMRLDEGAFIKTFAKLEKEEEIEKQAEQAEQEAVVDLPEEEDTADSTNAAEGETETEANDAFEDGEEAEADNAQDEEEDTL